MSETIRDRRYIRNTGCNSRRFLGAPPSALTADLLQIHAPIECIIELPGERIDDTFLLGLTYLHTNGHDMVLEITSKILGDRYSKKLKIDFSTDDWTTGRYRREVADILREYGDFDRVCAYLRTRLPESSARR